MYKIKTDQRNILKKGVCWKKANREMVVTSGVVLLARQYNS